MDGRFPFGRDPMVGKRGARSEEREARRNGRQILLVSHSSLLAPCSAYSGQASAMTVSVRDNFFAEAPRASWRRIFFGHPSYWACQIVVWGGLLSLTLLMEIS